MPNMGHLEGKESKAFFKTFVEMKHDSGNRFFFLWAAELKLAANFLFFFFLTPSNVIMGLFSSLIRSTFNVLRPFLQKANFLI